VLLAVALLILLGQAWISLSGAPQRLPESRTPGQDLQTGFEIAGGLLSLLAVATTFWRRAWAPWVLAGWVFSVTLASGLASAVWARAGLARSLITGGATLLVALGVTWLWRAGARGSTHA